MGHAGKGRPAHTLTVEDVHGREMTWLRLCTGARNLQQASVQRGQQNRNAPSPPPPPPFNGLSTGTGLGSPASGPDSAGEGGGCAHGGTSLEHTESEFGVQCLLGPDALCLPVTPSGEAAHVCMPCNGVLGLHDA